MPLAVLSSAEAAHRLASIAGGAPGSVEALSELLRAEIHARGHAQRAATIDRIARLLAPVTMIDTAQLADVCVALERGGDFTDAPGGVLFATPVRAVVVRDRCRIFGSMPSLVLAAALQRAITARGTARSVDATEPVDEGVRSVGGAMLTPEAWAGLERTPRADAAFIAMLDQRLAWEPVVAGALEHRGALEWRTWDPSGDAPRWRRSAEGRLWRASRPLGGHHRAWTTGGPPTTSAFVELTADEGDRARFALTREAGGRSTVAIERTAGSTTLDVPVWLPRAEYRWLSLHAARSANSDDQRWDVHPDDAPRIIEMLADRLGVTAEDR